MAAYGRPTGTATQGVFPTPAAASRVRPADDTHDVTPDLQPGDDLDRLADAYRDAVLAAQRAGIDADPEAQLTTPIDVLLTTLAARAEIGALRLIREQQLVGSRPDFGVLCDGRFCGWIELKKPDTAIDDPSTWTGHNGRQWRQLAQLENLLLTNGREMRWFRLGEATGEPAPFPYGPGRWEAQAAARLLRQFAEGRVTPITAVSALARRLAPLARDLRDRILFHRTHIGAPGAKAARDAHHAWRAYFQEDANDAQFADAVAQVIAYGLVIAALEGDADQDDDGIVTLAEARVALHGHHRLLSAALAPILEVEGFLAAIELEVGAIERLVSAVDVVTVRARKDPRGEPWLWFYEDFLASYDPQARKQAGVYYTPIEVVECMTRLVDDVLATRFGLSKGFGDPAVTTLDPACGTGTFPLAVTDRAAERMLAERGAAGPAQAATTLGRTLFGFELLPGPYAVAHLRITERLRELGGRIPDDGVNVLLADTLASPHDDTGPQLALFGDAAVLAAERRRAQDVKRLQPVMVILGNPPYRRVDRESAGGWIVHGDSKTTEERAPFASVVARANEHTIFSHRRSLYNLYTYFWRWAIWKAFEAHGAGPGVVGFITGSSWISGPGFIGLRELALKHADDVLVIDLGGDNKGAIKEENVFAIESPVAIVLLIRDSSSDGRRKAQVRYHRVEGTAAQKLAALAHVRTVDGADWDDVTLNGDRSFIPPSGGSAWHDHPAIDDLFPWQQPGCIISRLWPVAPDPDVLRRRWRALLSDRDPAFRADRFATAKTGRNIESTVEGLPRIVDLPEDADPPPVTRYGWRSFDRQWVLEDPRLAKTEGPSLWQSRSPRQMFLAVPSKEAIGPGPTAIATCDVPDFHHIRGSAGGKDILPLYRDAAATEPNVTEGALDYIGEVLGLDGAATPEAPMAYAYAVLSTPHFQRRFAEELRTPGIRVPLTRVPELWRRAVEKGSWLLWLHTYAERFQDPESGRGTRVPHVEELGWQVSVSELPSTTSDVSYDASACVLRVGDGRVSGVDQAVWEYAVSGMDIVKRWLGFRTAKGIGNAATKPKPLDRIRPIAWLDEWNDELLDLLRVLTLTVRQFPAQDALVDAICDGPLIRAGELPQPAPAQRKVPKTIRGERGTGALPLTDA